MIRLLVLKDDRINYKSSNLRLRDGESEIHGVYALLLGVFSYKNILFAESRYKSPIANRAYLYNCRFDYLVKFEYFRILLHAESK